MPKATHMAILSALGISLLTGCATPAVPRLAPERVVGKSAPLMDGYYDVTFHTSFVGPIRGRLIAETDGNRIKANTPPGVAWRLVGGFEKVLGPVLAPFLFPRGMILTWESALPGNDGPANGTLGIGSIAALRTSTVVPSPDAPIEIRWRGDNRLIGLVTAHKVADPGQTPPPFLPGVDYSALAARLAQILPDAVYDRALGDRGEFRAFADDLAEGAAKSQDDIEFLLAAGLAARKNVRSLFPIVYPAPTPENNALLAGRDDVPAPQRLVVEGDIATLRFDSFIDPRQVDDAFAEALSKRPKALILDLRTCAGVDLAALRAACWLVDSAQVVGTYFDQRTRVEALNGTLVPPAVTDIGRGVTAESLQASLHASGAASFRVLPDPDRFTGPVAVLTSRRTSSTAEALAWVLKNSGHAFVAGERTAGRPYLAGEFDLGQNWLLRIAAYDFVPADHARFNDQGVSPNLRVPASAAPAAARKELLRRLGEPAG